MENASKALIIAGAILISILLITIGIILINSGRDITDTGVSEVNSNKIQAFNSKFTAYEGTRKGSEIKNLVNIVRSSNATDDNHQIMLSCTAKGGGNKIHASISELKPTRDYVVLLNYTASTPTSDVSMTSGAMLLAGGSAGKIKKDQTEAGYIYEIVIQDPK